MLPRQAIASGLDVSTPDALWVAVTGMDKIPTDVTRRMPNYVWLRHTLWYIGAMGCVLPTSSHFSVLPQSNITVC
jgi:hypothetical protein